MYNNDTAQPFNNKCLWFSMAAFVLMTLLMKTQGKPLQTGCAPMGIVSMELAYTISKADSIKKDWQHSTPYGQLKKDIALNNVLIDFFYIAAYGFFLSLLAYRVSTKKFITPRFHLLPTLVLIACIFDIVENAGLLYTLQKHSIGLILVSTAIAALVKFSLLLVVLLWLSFIGLKGYLQKQKKRKIVYAANN